MITFSDAQIRIAGRVLLQGATFAIHPGWRVGLTGANGAGKSTLLRVIQGSVQLDTGEMTLPGHWVKAEVEQEIAGYAGTLIDYVLDGDTRFREAERLVNQAQAANDGERLAKYMAQFQDIGGYEASAKAGKLLSGLGFKTEQHNTALASFSGGWQVRAALARALMCQSDLLLLDEPTNHLDLDAVTWLQTWLSRYEGTLIVISHDRSFLDAVVNHVVHLEHCTATLYKGNYSQMQSLRVQTLKENLAKQEKIERQRKHLQSFIDRFKAKATKAKQAQSRVKAMAKLEDVAILQDESGYQFAFSALDRSINPMIHLEDLVVGYGDTPLLAPMNLSVHQDSRIGLIGPNGAGKSTLIRTLAEAQAPVAGQVVYAKHLRVGYFAQHQLELMDYRETPIQILGKVDQAMGGLAAELELRSFLGRFGFNNDRVFEVIDGFSGGEKSRLGLACLVYQKPHCLLLDEPTNHLDLEMRDALNLALSNFEGAVVVISHDKYLLDSVCNEFLLVADGRADWFDGTLDDYVQWSKLRTESKAQACKRENAVASTPKLSAADKRKEAARIRELLRPKTKQLNQLETKLTSLQSSIEALEHELARPELYTEEAHRVEGLSTELGQQKELLADIEEQWLTLGEELEQMQAELESSGA